LPFALTGIVDENSNAYATWTYDQNDRALSSQVGSGAKLINIAYDDVTGNRTVTNALGQTETYSFTVLQAVPKIMEIDRLATATTAAATRTFTYDSNGYLASATDWNGHLTTYVNDSRGEPTTINEAVGTAQARTTTITYLSNYHLPSQIVTPGLTTNFTYDSSGDLLTKALVDTTATTTPYSTSGQSRAWTYTWSNSLLASSKSPNGNTTSFTYDGSGALIKTKNALNQTTQVTTHTPGGWPQVIVDANGVTTTLTYDARLRLLSSAITTGAGILTTSYGYDAAGNLLSITLPDASALTNTYDAAHRLVGTSDLFSNKIAYTLDAFGDRTNTAVSNPAATVTRQHSGTFDALGRLLDDVGGVGQTTAYSYDSNGNRLTIIDPLSRLTQQSFDALNRVTQITDPAMGSTGISYDGHDRPLSVTDPNGNTTSYTYDGFGDVIQEVSPARGTTVYRYDLDGNLIKRTDARGAIADYTYDALDRVTATTYPADTAENVSYTYDQAAGGFGVGRLTSVTDAAGTLSRAYDERGNVLTESRVHGSGASAVTLLTKYTYDAASRIASIAYPSGAVVAYTRDAMGRITAVTEKALGASTSTTVVSSVTYQPFGPSSGLTYGNGVAESRSFDLDYRLMSVAGTGSTQIQHLAYGYNAANDVLSITDAVTSANSQAFGYDVLDRLTSASGGYGSLGYTYDANGNRLTENPSAPMTLDGISSSITTLAYNQSGRLASTSAGTSQITQYTYDAFGQRLSKVGNVTATTLFQYSVGGQLLEETNAQGSAEADYIYLDGRPVAEITPPTGGQLYFLHDDRLGTPQVATNVSQTTVWVANYQPFGALNTLTSQTALLGEDLRFPGQENDLETGLYHNGFRDYGPGWGRYAESDPTGLQGGTNTYGYVLSDPINRLDVKGLDVFIDPSVCKWFGGCDKVSPNPYEDSSVLPAATENQAEIASHEFMSTIPVFGVGCAIGSLFGPEFCPAGGAIGEGLLVAYTAYEEFENQVVKSNSEGVCPLKK
jgi:RHS repeat-associated protein